MASNRKTKLLWKSEERLAVSRWMLGGFFLASCLLAGGTIASSNKMFALHQHAAEGSNRDSGEQGGDGSRPNGPGGSLV